MQGKLHVPQLKHHLRIWLELVLITKTAAFFFLQIAPMLAVLPVCNIKEHLCLFEHSIWQFETKTAVKQLHLATPTTDTSQDQSL